MIILKGYHLGRNKILIKIADTSFKREVLTLDRYWFFVILGISPRISIWLFLLPPIFSYVGEDEVETNNYMHSDMYLERIYFAFCFPEKAFLATFTLSNMYFFKMKLQHFLWQIDNFDGNCCVITSCNQENKFNKLDKFEKIWQNRNFVWFSFHSTRLWVSLEII